MNRLLVLMACAASILVCFPAHARWVKIESDPSTGATFYFENEKVQRRNELIYYWHRVDLPMEENGVKRWSIRSVGNCDLSMRKPLEGIYYNARGRRIARDIYEGKHEKPWHVVIPNSYEESILQQACSAP